MMLPTLEILVSTNSREALEEMASHMPPAEEGVSWLVSWQKSDGLEAPAALSERSDVRIVRNPGSGLSQNRNFALDHAEGDILLIADDDLIYREGGFDSIRRAFALNPSLDIALFRYENENGTAEKHYPDKEMKIGPRFPKGYYVSSVEIALRRDGKSGNLRFDERFGLGAPLLGAGEEEIFVYTALCSAHEVKFFPITICMHPEPTTGNRRQLAASALRGTGATICLMYPFSWPLRLMLKAWRVSRSRQGSFLPTLRSLTRGAAYAIHNIKRP